MITLKPVEIAPHSSTPPLAFTPSRIAKKDWRMSLGLFLLALTCYSYCVQTPGWNQTSRMALVMSVVNQGRLNIDAYQESTGDKALYNGHYYSDKAIGTALLAIPVYAGLRLLQDFDHQPRLDKDLRYPIYVVTVVVVALPSAALLVLLYLMALTLTARRGVALGLSLLYGFGTLAFPFSTMLFGHQLAAASSFAAFFVLFSLRRRPPLRRLAWAARLSLAGGLAGWSVCVEYQTVVIAGVLGIYAASFIRPKWQLVFYGLGGLPWAGLLLGYNWLSLGSPFHFAYQYVSNADFAGMQSGLFGITWPNPSSFVEIMVGPRGLLVQSPFLLLLPLGVWQMWQFRLWRRELLVCLAVGLVFVLWNSAYYLPLGGVTSGPRFLIPALPFVVLPLAFIGCLPRRLVWPAVLTLVLTGMWSLTVQALIWLIEPQASLEYLNPLEQFWLPGFLHEHFLLNGAMLRFGWYGWRSLAPLLLVVVVAVDLLFQTLLSNKPPARWKVALHFGLLVTLYLLIAFPINPMQPFTTPVLFS